MQDFWFYLKLGWDHIIAWDALDHQLFVLVLVAVYSAREWRKLLILITAFTLGHSLTLALSVLTPFRLPSDWVEFLIPLTILLTAADNILMRNRTRSLMRLNFYLALFFGLVHGLGFANAARMMLSQEQSLFVPLLTFNTGLEAGQIVVVLFIILLEFLLIRFLALKKKHWMVAVSLLAFLFSLKLCLERFPL